MNRVCAADLTSIVTSKIGNHWRRFEVTLHVTCK